MNYSNLGVLLTH